MENENRKIEYRVILSKFDKRYIEDWDINSFFMAALNIIEKYKEQGYKNNSFEFKILYREYEYPCEIALFIYSKEI